MILQGDCLDQLKQIEDSSIDSLVTDPPAGISFMGKSWDGDKGGRNQWIAWMSEVMQECMRVLKPGAHGLVWALPRTSHWTATALEDAGFEVRDVVNHIFGSGFPKSLDVSKAIDKAAGAKREVIGENPNARKSQEGYSLDGESSNFKATYNPITAPATPEAKQWEGWGTALKPSVEMWLLVGKPFTTVPLDTIIDQINSDLRNLICHQLPAKYAQQLSMSNLRESSGQQFDFAQWIVDVFDTIKSIELEPKTDTSISPDLALIFSNIAMSWKAILDVLLLNRNTFTTKTESNLITELKTLKYSILQTMQKNITRDLTKQNAEMFIASTVLASLVSALLRLKGLMEIFAQENVSMQAANSEKRLENQQILGLEIVEDALRNQHEHWILVRKPLSEKTVAKNVLKHGTGALNIDASRIGTEAVPQKRKTGNSNSISYKENGGPEYTNLPWEYSSGRFPANLILSEESAKELDEHSGKRSSGGGNCGKMGGIFGNGKENSNRANSLYFDNGGASRFFFVYKEEPKHVNQSVCKDTNANIATSNFLISQEIEKIASTIFAQENAPLFLDLANLYLNASSAERSAKNIEIEHAHDLVKTLFKKDLQLHHYLVFILEHSETIPSLCHAIFVEMLGNTDITKIIPTQTQLFGFASYVTGNIIILAKSDPSLRLPQTRFIYQSKASKSDKGADNTHPTVKSTKLMEYLIKLITPPGGRVLDPFMGSGSTGVAAKKLGFDFSGIEQSKEYWEIAQKRINL